MASVTDPGLVAVFDVDPGDPGAGREPFFVMELCPGGSLADRLGVDRPMAPGELVPILVSVSDALATSTRRAGPSGREAVERPVRRRPREGRRLRSGPVDAGAGRAISPSQGRRSARSPTSHRSASRRTRRTGRGHSRWRRRRLSRPDRQLPRPGGSLRPRRYRSVDRLPCRSWLRTRPGVRRRSSPGWRSARWTSGRWGSGPPWPLGVGRGQTARRRRRPLANRYGEDEAPTRTSRPTALAIPVTATASLDLDPGGSSERSAGSAGATGKLGAGSERRRPPHSRLLDLGRGPRHLRGQRVAQGPAPMRETLAVGGRVAVSGRLAQPLREPRAVNGSVPSPNTQTDP
jgi:hypothetical protein